MMSRPLDRSLLAATSLVFITGLAACGVSVIAPTTDGEGPVETINPPTFEGGAGGTAPGGSATPAAADGAPTTAPASSTAPTDEEAPAAEDPEVANAKFRNQKTMVAAIGKVRPKVRDCYEAGKKQDKSLKGMLTMNFKIDPEGKVETVKLVADKSDITMESVVTCAIEVLKTVKFKPHEKGMESEMNYPFGFNR